MPQSSGVTGGGRYPAGDLATDTPFSRNPRLTQRALPLAALALTSLVAGLLVGSAVEGSDDRAAADFARTWDRRYQTVLETHDPGEPPLHGGLLIAPVGKGSYVYTGLSFFRQLPAGVPGAFRLFANLLALPHGR